MGDTGRDHISDAGPGDDLLAADVDPHRAFDDLEALFLQRVYVGSGDVTARAEEVVRFQALSSGLVAGYREDGPLSRQSLLNHVSGTQHGYAPPIAWK